MKPEIKCGHFCSYLTSSCVHHVNNNNNKGSRGMGEVVPLYGVDPALVLTNPGVQ